MGIREPDAVIFMREQMKPKMQEAFVEPLQSFYPHAAKINTDQSQFFSDILSNLFTSLDPSGEKLNPEMLKLMLKNDPGLHQLLLGFIDTLKNVNKDDLNLLMDINNQLKNDDPREALMNVFRKFLENNLPENANKKELVNDLTPKLTLLCQNKMKAGKSFSSSFAATLAVALTLVNNEHKKMLQPEINFDRETTPTLDMTPLVCGVVISQVDELKKVGITPALALSHLMKFDTNVPDAAGYQEKLVERSKTLCQDSGRLAMEKEEWGDVADKTPGLFDELKSNGHIHASSIGGPKPPGALE